MKFICAASLNEYAKQFWQRQDEKKSHDDKSALLDIKNGGNPVSWLANMYPDKLPKPFNARIDLVQFETAEELDDLMIHGYMVRDTWMVERCLAPCPKTRRLGDMAAIALDRKYFETGRPETQARLFQEWKDKTSLAGFIDPGSYPLVEATWESLHEIVDGWGRLHAMSALLKKGLRFEPFNCFVAKRA